MKKFLLLSALALGVFTARADYSDYFTLKLGENEIQNGEILKYTDFEDNTNFDFGGGMIFNMGYDYVLDFELTNTTNAERAYISEFLPDGLPTKEEYLDHQYDYVDGTMYTVWGNTQICNNVNCFTGPSSEENFVGCTTNLKGKESSPLQSDLKAVAPETVSRYKYRVALASNPSEALEFTIYFGPSIEAINAIAGDAAVEGIINDFEGAPEYYNLNGTKVSNPGNGIYIVKRGSKVTKEIIRN